MLEKPNAGMSGLIRGASTLMLVSACLLAGCASSAKERKAGAYYLDDGPGKVDQRRLAKLMTQPDPVPVPEKLRPRANRPYTVMGQRYTPMTEHRPYRQQGVASWYGQRFHGKPTSIGEPYDMYGMTAAHPTLPLPSYVRVRNLENGRTVVVRVNDRGPFLRGRLIDLSFLAAHKLGYVHRGHARVEVELIDPEAPRLARSAGGASRSLTTAVQEQHSGEYRIGASASAATAAAGRDGQAASAGEYRIGAAGAVGGASGAVAAGAASAVRGGAATASRVGAGQAAQAAGSAGNAGAAGAGAARAAVPAGEDGAGQTAGRSTMPEVGARNRRVVVAADGAAGGTGSGADTAGAAAQGNRVDYQAGPAARRVEEGRVIFEGWGAEDMPPPIRRIDVEGGGGARAGQTVGAGSGSIRPGAPAQTDAVADQAGGAAAGSAGARLAGRAGAAAGTGQAAAGDNAGKAAAAGGWYLQFGVFRAMDNALRARRAQMARAGAAAPPVDIDQQGERFVVRQGPYPDEASATDAARAIEAGGGQRPSVKEF